MNPLVLSPSEKAGGGSSHATWASTSTVLFFSFFFYFYLFIFDCVGSSFLCEGFL